jgi:hypothetical protein
MRAVFEFNSMKKRLKGRTKESNVEKNLDN